MNFNSCRKFAWDTHHFIAVGGFHNGQFSRDIVDATLLCSSLNPSSRFPRFQCLFIHLRILKQIKQQFLCVCIGACAALALRSHVLRHVFCYENIQSCALTLPMLQEKTVCLRGILYFNSGLPSLKRGLSGGFMESHSVSPAVTADPNTFSSPLPFGLSFLRSTSRCASKILLSSPSSIFAMFQKERKDLLESPF